ncbi:hypothetical protein LGN35_30540 [Burkholderia multivorans]|nr:hypothetical protein [Burkholderia multivorans]
MQLATMKPGVYRPRSGVPAIWFSLDESGKWERLDYRAITIPCDGDAAPPAELIPELVQIA